MKHKLKLLKKIIVLIIFSFSLYVIIVETIALTNVNEESLNYKRMYLLASDYISFCRTQNSISSEILNDIDDYENLLNSYAKTGNERIKSLIINTNERHESMVNTLKLKHNAIFEKNKTYLDSIVPEYKEQFKQDFNLMENNVVNLINYIMDFKTTDDIRRVYVLNYKSVANGYFNQCEKVSQDLLDKYIYERTFYYREFNSKGEKKSLAFKNLLLALIPFLAFGLDWIFKE